jgi:hypothetical protein
MVSLLGFEKLERIREKPALTGTHYVDGSRKTISVSAVVEGLSWPDDVNKVGWLLGAALPI